MTKKVSFGFDGVLNRPDVQEFIQELIKSGVEVFITTSEYNPMLSNMDVNYDTSSLWSIVNKLGIPCQNVIFTNMLPKSIFMTGSNCLFHLDSSPSVKYDIEHCTRIPVVITQEKDFLTICKNHLKNAHN